MQFTTQHPATILESFGAEAAICFETDMGLTSLAKYVFVLLYALNYKGTLFVWHIRFVWLCLKHTVSFKLLQRPAQLTAAKDIWKSRKYHGRATMGDLDFNLHKSNSTYFSDADMARTDFCLQHFPETLVGNFKQHFALGAIAATFKREIAPYEAFTIETRLFAWTEKWIFLQSRFLGSKGDPRAQSLAQYCLKEGRKTIKPETILANCGYELSEEVLIRNKTNAELASALLKLQTDLGESWTI